MPSRTGPILLPFAIIDHVRRDNMTRAKPEPAFYAVRPTTRARITTAVRTFKAAQYRCSPDNANSRRLVPAARLPPRCTLTFTLAFHGHVVPARCLPTRPYSFPGLLPHAAAHAFMTCPHLFTRYTTCPQRPPLHAAATRRQRHAMTAGRHCLRLPADRHGCNHFFCCGLRLNSFWSLLPWCGSFVIYRYWMTMERAFDDAYCRYRIREPCAFLFLFPDAHLPGRISLYLIRRFILSVDQWPSPATCRSRDVPQLFAGGVTLPTIRSVRVVCQRCGGSVPLAWLPPLLFACRTYARCAFS